MRHLYPQFISAAEGLGNKKGSKLKLTNNKVAVSGTWDVIVVGGGPSGCTAAIAAAREGARTLLIEATGQLGGMGTIGMVPAWCPFSDGEKMIYRGLAEQVFNRAKKGVPHEPKDKLDWVNINAEYLMRVYDNMVAEAGAKVLFFSRLAAVEKSGNGTIDAIIVANKEGLTAYKAKIFIDATGDGDLAAWAGAEFLKGDRMECCRTLRYASPSPTSILTSGTVDLICTATTRTARCTRPSTADAIPCSLTTSASTRLVPACCNSMPDTSP